MRLDPTARDEEEEEAALAVVADAVEAFTTRGTLVVHHPSAMQPLLMAYAQFLASAIDQAPALGSARACRRSHSLLALASKVSGGRPSSDVAAVAAAVGRALL